MFDPKNFDKIKNIIILHHDDMDGYISARQLVCEFSTSSNKGILYLVSSKLYFNNSLYVQSSIFLSTLHILFKL